MRDRYGDLRSRPGADAARIPYNSGNGPAQFSMNLRVSKSIGIGPRVERERGARSCGPAPGGPGGWPSWRWPGEADSGPGGLSGRAAARLRLDQELPGATRSPSLRWRRNVFNNVNLAQPVGVLESPLFGKSNALAGGFFSSPASNRSIDLQMTFSF